MTGRERYTSRAFAGARMGAQRGLLKPFVWSIVNVQVHGKENLRSLDGGFVVVANHSSHLDTPLVMGALPRRLSRYLAVGAAADYWFRNWWRAVQPVLFFNAFPVERTGSRNRKGLAGNLLSDGVPLLLYPEGTRSRTGAMAPFKPGAAALCISRNVPAVPVAIVGARAAMPTGRGLPTQGRPPVHVVLGSPMYARPDDTALRFSERIALAVREMHDQTALTMGFPTLDDYARMAADQEAQKERAAAEKSARDKERRDKASAAAAERIREIREMAERARAAAVAATKREPKAADDEPEDAAPAAPEPGPLEGLVSDDELVGVLDPEGLDDESGEDESGEDESGEPARSDDGRTIEDLDGDTDRLIASPAATAEGDKGKGTA